MSSVLHVDLDRANHFVLAKQHLTPASKTNALVGIAGDIGGLHATGPSTPYLSLFARTRRFERADLDKELYEKRSLAKIRCVRKTVYVHPKDVIPFVFSATAGMVARDSRRYMEFRGVTSSQFRRLAKSIVEMLRGTEMTASAIKAELHRAADVSAILYLLCDQGVLIRAKPEKSWKDKKQSYALFADYFPDIDLTAVSDTEARSLLIRHYIAAFGPVSEDDVVWWTGLGKRVVQHALEGLSEQILRVGVLGLEGKYLLLRSDQRAITSLEPPEKPAVNLLPVQDPYLMGYRHRARTLDERFREFVYDRSGNATSTILVAGQVVGVWDCEAGENPAVKIFLFREATRGVRDQILDYGHRIGEFIFDQEVRVVECKSMTPLTKRTAGSMMSPLKGC